MDKKSFIITSLSFFAFIALFFWFFWDAQSKIHSWIKTEGVVVNNKIEVNGYSGSIFYSPQVQFKTQDGQGVVGSDTGIQFGGLFDNKIGDNVTLYYYPSDPKYIYVYNTFYVYYATLIPMFLFIGFYILVLINIKKGTFGKTSILGKSKI